MTHKKIKIDPRVFHCLYILILLLFPLIGCNRGVSYTDETCSIANYMYIDSLTNFWKYGYYYALLLGRLFTNLPFGNYMVAVNIYCSLFVGITAVIAYLFCRKLMRDYFAFFGVFFALTMTWCSNVILYNYMTYFFFMLGVICLFLAVDRDEKKYYVVAGVALAQNVFVRFPNVLEAGLILAVWFYFFISKKRFRDALDATGLCITGYIAGLAVGCIIMMIRGDSASDYFAMIGDIFKLSENANGYSLTDMIKEVLGSYWYPKFFLFVMTAVTVFAGIVFMLAQKLTAGKEKLQHKLMLVGEIGYGAVALLMFYWFHRRGLFFFDYNSYGAFKIIADMMLVFLWILVVYVALNRKVDKKLRFYAFMMIIQLLVTPLGSNNGTYPIINNMFLMAPFLVLCWMDYMAGTEKIFSRRIARKPAVGVMTTVFIFVLLCQALNFRLEFTFRDGENGEAVNTQVAGIECLAGMHTTKSNAEELKILYDHVQETTNEGDDLIVYGMAPGLFYILDRPAATRNLWLDLETNNKQSLMEDLVSIGQRESADLPCVILAEGLTYETLTKTDEMSERDAQNAEKQVLLAEYLWSHEYSLTLQTEHYAVYAVKR